MASGTKTPEVWTATGAKWWMELRCGYFRVFVCPAWVATNPASLAARATCDGAKVSGQVASQTKATFPGHNRSPIWSLSIWTCHACGLQDGRNLCRGQWPFKEVIHCCISGVPSLALSAAAAVQSQVVYISTTLVALVPQPHASPHHPYSDQGLTLNVLAAIRQTPFSERLADVHAQSHLELPSPGLLP